MTELSGLGRTALHVRTRFFDDFLMAAATAGIRQVVLLAAGLDARAYRLDWPPEVRLYEVDLPKMLAFKERVLTQQVARPRCTRVVVPADLRSDWAGPLAEAGFDPTRPTAWLAEGLLIHLSAEDAASLLRTVGDLSSAGSRLALEHGALADSLGGLGQETVPWLAGNGWRPIARDSTAVGVGLGGPGPDSVGGSLIEATREWPSAEVIPTERLVLEPVRPSHADEMATVLDDERLHDFIGGQPSAPAELLDRYVRWAAGSPDVHEGWLNWVVRTGDGEPVGTVQVTLSVDSGRRVAELAWVVGMAHQGRGYAVEAGTAVADWLRRNGTDTLLAHIHPTHQASMAVAGRLGLHPTPVTVDGETRWTT